MNSNRTHLLLLLVAALLLANLVVTVGGWIVNPPNAQANIVEGKNWFSTTSEDGRTVYLWQYITSAEVGPNARGKIQYYGRITAGGTFQE